MNDFDQILDDSLRQIASGAVNADECLAQHPEYSVQLKPILQSARLLGRGRELTPSGAFKTRARDQLMDHIRAHSHGKNGKLPLIWTIAMSLAALAILFFVTGTAVAQGALPGQALYDWKLTSEDIWRATTPDRVGVDLELADRRISEITSVSSDSANEAKAIAGYKEVLTRLNSENDVKNNDRILLTLKSNQIKLSAVGIIIPELNKHISP